MSKQIITVSREFGSGGRTIAKQIAECLGYAYYDKELVIQIAREGNLAESFVLESGEYACSTNSFLFNLDLYAGAAYTNSLPISDQLYLVQYNVIKELAGKGPCVIVGRCADYVLRDRNDCLHTFFHADAAFRADRIVGVYGETHENPEKRLKEKDEKRKIYYKHYTGRQWGIAQNYHISLDSGEIGIQQSVDIVVNLVKASL
jgi:cytidylate kinase